MSNYSESNNQIARAAGTVMLAFTISQIFGLIRRILVAQAFGASIELDAFIAANRVSETLFNLIAGGALGSAFIPTFTALLAKGKKNSAWKLASSIANLIIIISTFLSSIAFFIAPQIVRYALAPGLAETAQVFQLTVNLLRIQLISAILFGLSGLIMGILNSHQVFWIPALTPSMYQLGMIFGVIVLCPFTGIYGLAWGVVIGAFLHLLLQIPSLLKLKGSYSLELGIGNPDVGEVLRLIVPRLAGVAVVQLNFWVNSALASKMDPGSLVGVDYGFSLMLMAQAVIAQSVATAMMPTLASQFALGKLDAVRHSLIATLRGVLFLAVPASIGLIILREPVIEMLYQRGSFDSHSTELVAWALLWYAAGLIGHSILEILARAFYSLHDTKTPVIVGTIAMGLNIVLSFSFSALFDHMGWMPHGGLALANSVATVFEAIALLVLMRIRLRGLLTRGLFFGFLQALSGSILMGFIIYLWLEAVNFPAWLNTLGGILIGGIVYSISLLILQVSEIHTLFRFLKNRISH